MKPTGEGLMINDLIKVAGTMGEVIELVGVLIIFLGFIYAFFSVFFIKREKNEERVLAFRTLIKKNMLLGLDFLVAGDIIRTVTVDPSLTGVASLGFLVLIRTALVFTIHLEIEGHWPWQHKAD
jgi:uncharacterized membrane protein